MSLQKQKKMIGVLIILLALLIGFVQLVKIFNFRGATHQWNSAVKTHSAQENGKINPVWTLENVFIDCLTCVVATENQVYVLGSLKNHNPMSLIKLDLFSGQAVVEKPLTDYWLKGQGLGGLNTKYVYIRRSATQKIASLDQSWGAAQVVAFDIETFDKVWSERFSGSGGVKISNVTEDTIAVTAINKVYQVDAVTGEKVGTIGYVELIDSSKEIKYLLWPTLVQAVDSENGEVIWSRDISGFDRTFVENKAVIIAEIADGGQSWGGVTVIDSKTGETIWEKERVISNVAISNGYAHMMVLEKGIWGADIDLEMHLLSIDVNTGTVASIFDFQPSTIQSGYGNYKYVLASSGNMILAYLGDGRQLFAFHFLPES